MPLGICIRKRVAPQLSSVLRSYQVAAFF
jgi:hypothetical protein